MDTFLLTDLIEDFIRDSGFNHIPAEKALNEELIGLDIFSSPVVGIAAANDPAFFELKKKEAVGEHFLLPREWLPNGNSVVSFFLPFTERVKRANAADRYEPAPEWLHGRIEGQEFINRLSSFLVDSLRKVGYDAVAPSIDSRFASCTEKNTIFLNDKGQPLHVSFTSNWSERHVAYICGLGSFGLSKGFITKKGMAGRFGSVVTNLSLPPDNQIPSSVYENCTLCGACVRNCPVNAISLEKGKAHVLCAEYLNIMKKKHHPRYGCGKCQVGVPCESGIPGRIPSKSASPGIR